MRFFISVNFVIIRIIRTLSFEGKQGEKNEKKLRERRGGKLYRRESILAMVVFPSQKNNNV
jgi:hypothetical protein